MVSEFIAKNDEIRCRIDSADIILCTVLALATIYTGLLFGWLAALFVLISYFAIGLFTTVSAYRKFELWEKETFWKDQPMLNSYTLIFWWWLYWISN